MRPKSMVLIVIALVCGLVASIGISQVVERNSGNNQPSVQTKPIFVAMTDIGIGAELNAQSVKLEEWPIDKIPEGAITEAIQMDGKSPNQRLFAGEPLLIAKLSNADSLRLTSQTIKKGFRVMSVKVDMASAVSGLINPGDRVDVLAISGPKNQAEVILVNVEVFAINDRITREIDSEGAAIQAKTVSLLVTSEQAQKLMAHTYKSIITLSLRRPDDDSGVEDSMAMDQPLPVPPTLPVPSVPLSMPAGPPAKPVVEFTMEVFESGATEAVRRYAFDEKDARPREITKSVGGNAATPPEFPFPNEGAVSPPVLPGPESSEPSDESSTPTATRWE